MKSSLVFPLICIFFILFSSCSDKKAPETDTNTVDTASASPQENECWGQCMNLMIFAAKIHTSNDMLANSSNLKLQDVYKKVKTETADRNLAPYMPPSSCINYRMEGSDKPCGIYIEQLKLDWAGYKYLTQGMSLEETDAVAKEAGKRVDAVIENIKNKHKIK